MKHLLLLLLAFALQTRAEETPIHWEYFEPEVDYSRRLRVTGATERWEIVAAPGPKKSGNALKLTFDFSKHRRSGVLVFDLPVLAFDRIAFRIWNPNPPTVPLYIHLSAFQSSSVGALRENISFITRYYQGTSPDAARFLKPGVPSAPLPSSEEAGWVSYEVELPRDIADVVSKGQHRPPGDEVRANWKNYAFPTIAVMVETKPPAKVSGPVSLLIGDVEFFLSK